MSQPKNRYAIQNFYQRKKQNLQERKRRFPEIILVLENKNEEKEKRNRKMSEKRKEKKYAAYI